MDGLVWAAVGTALLVSLAALALGLVLAARYRQMHERVLSGGGGVPFPAPGAVAPRFDAVARDGTRIDGAALSRGRAVVVVFDTSCSACAEILPETSAFLAERPDDTVALALIGGGETGVEPYLSGLPTSVPVIAPASADLVAAFDIRVFPTILSYQDGRLVAAGSRPADVAVPASA